MDFFRFAARQEIPLPDRLNNYSLTNDLTKISPDSCVQNVETLVSVIYKKMGLDQNYYFPMHTSTR
jgi:hypothetical protein